MPASASDRTRPTRAWYEGAWSDNPLDPEMSRRRSSRAHGALAALVLLVTGCAGQPAVTYTSAAPSPSAASRNFHQDTTGPPPGGSHDSSGERLVRAEADAPRKPNALCQTGRAECPPPAHPSPA